MAGLNLDVFRKKTKGSDPSNALLSTSAWNMAILQELKLGYTDVPTFEAWLGRAVGEISLPEDLKNALHPEITAEILSSAFVTLKKDLAREPRKFFSDLAVAHETKHQASGKRELWQVAPLARRLLDDSGFNEDLFHVSPKPLQYQIVEETGACELDEVVFIRELFVVGLAVENKPYSESSKSYYQIPGDAFALACHNFSKRHEGDQEVFIIGLVSDAVTFYRATFPAQYIIDVLAGQKPSSDVTVHKFPQWGLGKSPYGPVGLRLCEPAERKLAFEYLAALRMLLVERYQKEYEEFVAVTTKELESKKIKL